MSSLPADPDSLLAGLDPQQREVACAVQGPVVVMAGAGTGKTRAITHRIAYAVATGAHDPARSLAVTFTNRAAGEMTSRLQQLGVPQVRVRTFHSAALRQLRWAWPQAIGGQMHSVINSKLSLISTAAASAKVPTDSAVIRDLATEIEWAKVVGVGPDEYPTRALAHRRGQPGGLEFDAVSAVYRGYEQAKRQTGRIDFEDVLLLTVGIFEDQPELLRKVRASFKYFTVDEFQDVSAVQRRLLTLWLGDGDEVCVVGDTAQTIYSFAGADPSHLLSFGKQFKNPTQIALSRCYRCTPEIVAVAEGILSAGDSSAKLLSTRKDRRVPLQSQRDSGPAPLIMASPTEEAEAAAVVARIQALIAKGTPVNEIAILVRINAITEQFESALADAGIPYTVRGGQRFFERPEVKRAVMLLRGAARAESTIGSQPDDIRSAVRAIVGPVGWSPKPPSGTGNTREAWESLSALVSLTDSMFANEPTAGLRDLVNELERRQEAQDAPAVEGVTIASLHSAKGLEWDAVFISGMVDGMIPMSHATTPAQIEEERRLLYVGATRARSELFFTWAHARIEGARPRKRSRFLSAIDLGTAKASRPKAKAPVKRRGPANCRVCGKALVTAPERSLGRCRKCPSDIDDDLLKSLQEWRSEQVRQQSKGRENPIPAYVVATDKTLEALAESRPQTLEELAQIPGLGRAKLTAYGDSLLALLTAGKK